MVLLNKKELAIRVQNLWIHVESFDEGQSHSHKYSDIHEGFKVQSP